MQTSLFDNNDDNIKKDTIVKINLKANLLTKNQIVFNNLTEEIKKTVDKNEKLKNHLQQLFSLHSRTVLPAIQNYFTVKIALVKKLYETANRVTLSKNQIEYLRSYILDVLMEAFEITQPSNEDIEFYNTISNSDYESDMKQSEMEMKEDLADDLFERFGLEIDPNEMGNSPEEQEELKRKIDEHFESMKGKSNKKKSKKQLATEAKEKEKETEKLKSIRSVYLSLVKLLHPDVETDENLKLQKEEIIKQVTVAYEAKDLATLLKIEMQWIANAQDDLQKMSDEKLLLYIKALREQLSDLKFERNLILNDPKFNAVSRFENSKMIVVEKAFENEIKSIDKTIEDLKTQNVLLDGKEAKKILKSIAAAQKELEEEDFFDDFMNF